MSSGAVRRDVDLPKPKSFTSCLKAQTDRDSDIGDLARDVADDPTGPHGRSRRASAPISKNAVPFRLSSRCSKRPGRCEAYQETLQNT